MAIDDNTIYGLTGAQVKEMVQRRGNTEISQEPSTYGNEGESLSLDSNGTSGHLRVGVDIMNDGSEGFLYFNDSYPGIRFPSTDVMYQVINDALPVNVSELYNDAGYQSASQVSSAIASAISGITSFSYEIVQTLPASGQTGTIYLIANTGTTPNIYDEYLWVNGNWEKIGTTEADLSQYYTKAEVDTALGAKANSADVYTKTQADTLLNAKQNTLTAGTGINIANNVISATGGSGPTVVQATGTSTADVMSQNAVTSMICNDPANMTQIRIGKNALASTSYESVGIGYNGKGTSYGSIGIMGESDGNRAIAIGVASQAAYRGSVALGSMSHTSQQGEMNIGTSDTSIGYNNSNYRLISGLYDPQSDHDAATKGYVDTAVAGAGAATFTTNEWNALWA